MSAATKLRVSCASSRRPGIDRANAERARAAARNADRLAALARAGYTLEQAAKAIDYHPDSVVRLLRTHGPAALAQLRANRPADPTARERATEASRRSGAARVAARIEDLEWMVAHGESAEGITSRTGVSQAATERFLWRQGRSDLIARMKANGTARIFNPMW